MLPWIRNDRIKGSRVYYYDYIGAIPLKDVLDRDFPDSYLHIYRFAVKVKKGKYFLIEPPDPDEFDFSDPADVLEYLHRFKKETKVYEFVDREEVINALLSRGIPPPPLP